MSHVVSAQTAIGWNRDLEVAPPTLVQVEFCVVWSLVDRGGVGLAVVYECTVCRES